ncbi:MAG: 30S ribosomal protein S16 [Candidatus Liberibacter europaeus]|uniref:Small ribosomal subunit protein bS16 n=1 Tax=Candidatus Liberibacter europaeus TaxID=744859 RepID=A0A2T4VXL6_9HYPH|nr:30S ribosomal protein S16 [Candidatus Liberibacter europaeus]PTL86508.1 MAG: 30S ribosomal protein S16 [Candidatus Liberibacter europaeus]
MAVKIRLACGGTKKRKHYRIVVANSSSSRDGKFLERIGHWSPSLSKEDPSRLAINFERVQYWISKGAQPTDRVIFFMSKAGMINQKPRNNPIKAKPKKKASARLAAQQKAEENATA